MARARRIRGGARRGPGAGGEPGQMALPGAALVLLLACTAAGAVQGGGWSSPLAELDATKTPYMWLRLSTSECEPREVRQTAAGRGDETGGGARSTARRSPRD